MISLSDVLSTMERVVSLFEILVHCTCHLPSVSSMYLEITPIQYPPRLFQP